MCNLILNIVYSNSICMNEWRNAGFCVVHAPFLTPTRPTYVMRRRRCFRCPMPSRPIRSRVKTRASGRCETKSWFQIWVTREWRAKFSKPNLVFRGLIRTLLRAAKFHFQGRSSPRSPPGIQRSIALRRGRKNSLREQEIEAHIHLKIYTLHINVYYFEWCGVGLTQ